MSALSEAAQLAEQIAAERARVHALTPCDGIHCAERLAHEARLVELSERFCRALPQSQIVHHTPFSAAAAFSDVLHFEVPVSHRSGLKGRAVTSAKRLVVRGLSPLAVELLRQQQSFNRETVAVLEQLRLRAMSREPTDLSGWVRAKLVPLSAGQAAAPKSHRRGIEGKIVNGAKRGALALFGRVLASPLQGQLRFNEQLARALSLASGPNAPRGDDAEQLVRELELSHDPVASAGRLEPLLREILRRQVAFNREALLCVAELLQSRAQAPASFPRFDYADWIVRHESRLRADWEKRFRALPAPPTVRHISSVQALSDSAAADWLVLSHPEDVLSDDALRVIAATAANSTADVLFADEDLLEGGSRTKPFFKPGFSPELLLSHPYLGRTLALRSETIRRMDVKNVADPYELALRLHETGARFERIPLVLTHRKSAKTAAELEAARLTVAAHLSRQKIDATVEASPDGCHVRYPVRGSPKVSIIVPFKDRPELLEQLTRTLPITRYRNYELLLVSNNSSNPRTYELIEQLKSENVRALRWDHPFNYPAINNWAARQADGELLLFLNNDMEIVDPGWLDELVSQAQRPEVGAVGPKLLFPDGTLQHTGVVVGITGFAAHPFWRFPNRPERGPFGHADWTRNYLSVTSACVMLRREVFESLGGFDEQFAVCGSDVDIGLRLVERGLRVVYTAATHLVHHESASRRLDTLPEQDYWQSFVAYRPYLEAGDPFYHPNLTLQDPTCVPRTDWRSGLELALATLRSALEVEGGVGARRRAMHQRHVSEHLEVFDALRMRSVEFAPTSQWVRTLAVLLNPATETDEKLVGLLSALSRKVDVRLYAVGPSASAFRLRDLPVEPLRSLPEIEAAPSHDAVVATDWYSAYASAAFRAAHRARWVARDEGRSFPGGASSTVVDGAYQLKSRLFFASEAVRAQVEQRHGVDGVVLGAVAPEQAAEQLLGSFFIEERPPFPSGDAPGMKRGAAGEAGLERAAMAKRERP